MAPSATEHTSSRGNTSKPSIIGSEKSRQSSLIDFRRQLSFPWLSNGVGIRGEVGAIVLRTMCIEEASTNFVQDQELKRIGLSCSCNCGNVTHSALWASPGRFTKRWLELRPKWSTFVIDFHVQCEVYRVHKKY